MIHCLPKSPALRGLLFSAMGMTVISPDGLLLHMLTSAPLMDIIFWRTFGMGISLLVGLTVLYRGALWTQIRQLGLNGWMAVGLMSLSNLLFVDAMAHTSVANTLVLMASMPLWSALLGLLILREAVRPSTWGAIALGLGGISVIMSDSLGLGGDGLRGDLSALGASITYGLNLVMLRRAGDRDMTVAVMLSGFCTAVICLPFLGTATIVMQDWAILALLGLFILPVAQTLFMSGARTAPAAEVALLSLVETLLGPLWAWLVLDEVPTVTALMGGGLILIAVSLPALATMAQRRATPAETAL